MICIASQVQAGLMYVLRRAGISTHDFGDGYVRAHVYADGKQGYARVRIHNVSVRWKQRRLLESEGGSGLRSRQEDVIVCRLFNARIKHDVHRACHLG